MISFLTEHWVDHYWLVLGMQVRGSMEWMVQVLDGGRHVRPGTDRVSMHWFLLWLAQGGKLRGYSLREALFSLIEVWRLLTGHSEHRFVLFRRPSRRLVCPSAIVRLLCSTSIWGLTREASYFGTLWFLEGKHLLVVWGTLHSTRVGWLMIHCPWMIVLLRITVLKMRLVYTMLLGTNVANFTVLPTVVAIFHHCWETAMMILWGCVTAFFACWCLEIWQFKGCCKSIFYALILACRWQCMHCWSFRCFASFRIRILVLV